MASEIKSDKLSPSTGTALQIGDASDTITIPTGATFTVTDGIGVSGGGTGLTSFTAGDILYATGSTTLAKLGKGTAEQVLAMNSGATAPDWGSVDLTVLPTITVAKGGTNLSSFTAGDILYATGSTTLAKLAKGTTLQHLRMNVGATAPEWTAAPGSGAILKGACKTVTAAESFTGVVPAVMSSYDLAFQATESDSKLWLSMSLNISHTSRSCSGYFYNSTAGAIASPIGDADGSRLRNSWRSFCTDGAFVGSWTYGCWYEPGNTTNNTYQIFGNASEATTMFVNRSNDTADSANMYYTRTASTFTILEYAASVITLS